MSLLARLIALLRPGGGGTPEPLPPEELLQADGQGIDFGLFLAALIVLLVGGFSMYWLFRAVQRNYRRVSAQRASRSVLGHLLLVLRALLASILGLFGWTRTVAQALGASVMALAGRRGAMRANLAAMRREGGGSVRQQLHAIYAETVDEASALGVYRGPSVTPSEYRERLAERCARGDFGGGRSDRDVHGRPLRAGAWTAARSGTRAPPAGRRCPGPAGPAG